MPEPWAASELATEPAPPASAAGVDEPKPRQLRRRVKRWILPVILLLLISAIVLPPLVNINRYQRRISQSISRALGRPVRISSAKLVMLPRPGFELTDFLVDEDPAFGAEPILRADTVVASLRLVSLWRGRIEIARIHVEDASLNLTRNRAGEWNFANVLVQAAKIPNAPTAQKHAGTAARFPYIDATGARINFKFGDEKLPFSFLDADLSVWLAEPQEWRLRFVAQPVRTDIDLDLGGTGLLRLEGSLQRAPALDQMPLDLSVEWSGDSIGQLGRLLVGHDPGWRGDIDLRARIVGTPENALIKARLRGSRIHRSEFEPKRSLAVDTTCEMHYRHVLEAIEGLNCIAPVGNGQVLLTGGITSLADAPHPVMGLQFERVPASELLQVSQVMTRGLLSGIHVDGDLDGAFSYDPARSAPLSGQGTLSALTVAADGLKGLLVFNNVSLASPPSRGDGESIATGRQRIRNRKSAGRARRSESTAASVSTQPSLSLSPLSLGAVGDPPLLLNASFDGSGITLHLVGSAPIARLVELSRGFHLLPLSLSGFGSQGSADVDLTQRSPWLSTPATADQSAGTGAAQKTGSGNLAGNQQVGSAQATPRFAMEGTLRLRNAQLTTAFLAMPLRIVAAQGIFSAGSVVWQPLSIAYGPVHAEGSMSSPVPCAAGVSGDGCVRQFDLRVAALDLAALQSSLLGARRGQLLEEILSRLGERPRPWPSLAGTLRVDTLFLNNAATTLMLHGVVAEVEAGGNTLNIKDLTGLAMGGRLQASGTVDAGGDPGYALKIDLAGADAGQAGAMFGERWGGGAIDLKADLKLSGVTAGQLAGSAAGTFDARWTGHRPGPGSGVGGAGGFINQFDSWVAEGTVSERAVRLDRSTMRMEAAGPGGGKRVRMKAAGDDGAGIPVTGTISFGRELRLVVGVGDGAVGVGGTLQHPVMSALGKK